MRAGAGGNSQSGLSRVFILSPQFQGLREPLWPFSGSAVATEYVDEHVGDVALRPIAAELAEIGTRSRSPRRSRTPDWDARLTEPRPGSSFRHRVG